MHKEIKDFKKDNAGRSMTEMLGVLAIIGVLSLGGIIGYKLAMNRYAANQIAYEINMMKTDAKVKIMQGNDALTLGQPYDGGTIRFGDYGTTFGCSFIKDADDESVVEEAATCQVANAYYIELQNIPEGICKPLANLIENMNDLVAFDINLTEGEEGRVGGECEEGENVLNAVFSAEPGDLDVLKCDSEKDCSGGLHCLNHLCVECIGPEDCTKGNAGICTENNTCDYCNEGEVRDGNGNCVGCMEDTHCPYKATAPHCDSETHTCGNCPIATPYWSNTLSKCVECTSSDFCVNPEPYCNPNTGECTQCTEDAQCDASQNEHCKVETGECIVCDSTKEVWDEDLKDCRPAKSCDELNCPTGLFCVSGVCSCLCSNNETTMEEACNYFECRSINIGFVQGKVSGRTYYGNKESLNWWSSQRYCQAAASMAGVNNGRLVSWSDINWQCYPSATAPDPINKKGGYCTETNADTGSNNVSDTIKDLRKMYECTQDYNCFPWVQEKKSSCRVYDVNLFNGQVTSYAFCGNGSYADYPLCIGD